MKNMVRRIFALSLTLLLCCSLNVSAFAVDESDSNTSKSATQRIYELVDAIDAHDWDTYVSYSCEEKYDRDKGFFANQENEESHTGIFNIRNAQIEEIYQVSIPEATKYTEYDLYSTTGSYTAFLVGIDCRVYSDTKYFSNGMNYFFILLVEESGEWKVAQFSSAALELLEHCSASNNVRTSNSLSKAIENTQLRYYGIYANEEGTVVEYNRESSGITAFATTEFTPPSTIRVYIKGESAVRNIDFTEYIQDVLPNEWIASWKEDQCLRAGAMAVKTYSWYCVLHPDHPDLGADVTDDPEDNQHYVVGSNHTRTNAAIRDTGGIGMQNSNSKIFRAEYRTGVSGQPGNEHGGKMSQYGSLYLAEQGYDFIEICDYYYSYSERSSGAIKTIVIGNA